ncbi:hypothetical protein BX600DRAFT_301390 [Xylariales sp. PMI_506]|nr:hypothetical protein BX600DRAFT_301390 [Xylariales sp. PMI_506]
MATQRRLAPRPGSEALLAQPEPKPLPQQRTSHSESEWVEMKDKITEMFINNRKNAEEILKDLEESYGFKTGLRALKAKLNQWKVRKNIKQKEMRIIIAKIDHRTSQGKDTLVKHGGLEIEATRLNNFRKRGSKNACSPMLYDAPTPPHIDISTPPSIEIHFSTVVTTNPGRDADQASTQNQNVGDKRCRMSALGDGCNDHFSPRPRKAVKTTTDAILVASEPGLLTDIMNEIVEVVECQPPKSYENFQLRDGLITDLDRMYGLRDEFVNFFEPSERIAFTEFIHNLQHIMKAPSRTRRTVSTSAAQTSVVSNETEFSSAASRVSRYLTDSSVYSINNNKPEYFKRWRDGRSVPHKRILQLVELDMGWNALIYTSEIRRSFTKADRIQHQYSKERITTVSIMPNESQTVYMLRISFIERPIFQEISETFCHIEVNRVIPDDSPVFRLVGEGRLDELRMMLEAGQASLRDHDEHGASLLFYAMEQPHMCRFLLDGGLDVDQIADIFAVDELGVNILCCPLQVKFDNDYDMETLNRRNQCRRLLLEFNADPTIAPDPELNSILELVCFDNTPDSIRVVWNSDLTGCFASISNYKDEDGSSALHLACGNFAKGTNAETIRAIIALGADIHARDKSGMTCLQVFLANLGGRSISIQTEFEVLEVLLHAGADIEALVAPDISVSVSNTETVVTPGSSVSDSGIAAVVTPSSFISDLEATTNSSVSGTDIEAVATPGRSVSAIAYRPLIGTRSIKHGSYAGDLWDAILHKSGYSIAQYRRGFQRHPKYTRYYKRADFEALWQGRKNSCPYWNDEPCPLGSCDTCLDWDGDSYELPEESDGIYDSSSGII